MQQVMALSSFATAYQQFTAEQQQELDAVIQKWEAYDNQCEQKTLDNFKNERFLPTDPMVEMLRLMLKSQREEFGTIRQEMRHLHVRFKYLGDNIRPNPLPTALGFVISKDEFKNTLARLYDVEFDMDDEEIEGFISSWCEGTVLPKYRELLLKEANKTFWMTWDQDEDDPFAFMKFGRSEEVIIHLAMDARYVRPPLLLFVLDRSIDDNRSFTMYRPTICDADFYEHFRTPPPRFEDHGFFEPLAQTIDYKGMKYLTTKRPETVVKAGEITLGHVRYVRYIN
jgi:uncharacterized coiled-coil protein SlyX